MSQAREDASRTVLLVEDEYFIADDMARAFEAQGVEVLGPAGSMEDALKLIEGADRLDGAVLDINLQGEMAFAVADALHNRGVPFVFATGYDRDVIPERFAHVIRCEKPVEPAKVTRSLFGLAA
ncbi:MAG TPA: response regulator [Mesorhizobium sp.]|jgi:CheY-like chemotaxis protein|nr:response regulator [Mesorhizobium sp.]